MPMLIDRTSSRTHARDYQPPTFVLLLVTAWNFSNCPIKFKISKGGSPPMSSVYLGTLLASQVLRGTLKPASR